MKKKSSRQVEVSRAEAENFIEQVAILVFACKRSDAKVSEAEMRVQVFERFVDAVMVQLNSVRVSVPKECPGEAHSNPLIDNCGVCAPNWGVISQKVKVVTKVKE